MTIPAVQVNKLEGQLGISNSGSQKLLAVMGPTSKGTASSPVALTRATDVVSQFGYGPAVQAACHAIEFYGQPVIIVKTPVTGGSAGTLGALVTTGWTGTSVVSNCSSAPIDEYELLLKVITGGTIGTAGITVRASLDNGRTFGPIVALGTATSITLTNPDGSSTGITLAFAAGTAVANDQVTAVSVAPVPGAADLTAGFTALQNSALNWECVELACAATSALTDALDGFIKTCQALGRFCYFAAGTRTMTAAEPDATYQTSVIAAFASSAYSTGFIVSGSVIQTSSVPQQRNQYVRSPLAAIAALSNSLPAHISAAQPIASNVLPNCTLTDVNGNLASRVHDEFLNPGLDDAGFTTVRSWPRSAGVWVTLPRIHCASGSDFNRLPKIRVWDRFSEALFDFFRLRIQAPVLVNSATGFIEEAFATELEKSAEQAARNAIMQAPSASALQVRVSRTDALLSAEQPTLTVTGTVVPLGYPEKIVLNLGFAVTLQKA